MYGVITMQKELTKTNIDALRRCGDKEYAAYRGEEFLDIGTIEYLSESLGYRPVTLLHRSYPAGHKRAGKAGIRLFIMDDDEEDF